MKTLQEIKEDYARSEGFSPGFHVTAWDRLVVEYEDNPKRFMEAVDRVCNRYADQWKEGDNKPYKRRQEIYPRIRVENFFISENERRLVYVTWVRKFVRGHWCLCKVKRETIYNPNSESAFILNNEESAFLTEVYRTLVTDEDDSVFEIDTHSQMSEATRLSMIAKPISRKGGL